MNRTAPYAKALIAFITPGVVALVAAVQDGSPGGSGVTGPEWVGIGAACVLTGSLVYAAPNKDPEATHQDESVQPAGDLEPDVYQGAGYDEEPHEGV